MTKEMEYGYWRYFSEQLKQSSNNPYITKVEDYQGEKNFVLSGFDGTTAQKNKAAKEWNDLFLNEQLSIDKLWITASFVHKFFDAVCCQKSLNGLFIKSGGCLESISSISKLQNIEYLHIMGGSRLTDIEVIGELSKLKSLEILTLSSVNDFSFCTKLDKLEELRIEGNFWSTMKKMNLKSLGFLEKLRQLERLNLCMLEVEDHSYLPILKLNNLKQLSLPNNKDIKKDIEMWQKFIKQIEKTADVVL